MIKNAEIHSSQRRSQMNSELSLRINMSSNSHHGQDQHEGNRRQQHQQKLKALINALDAGDLTEAKVNYHLLLQLSPTLAHSKFATIGTALASANLVLARQVIKELYGQNQALFRNHLPPSPVAPISSSSYLGVLVDSSA
jgi:hypothetical protein